MKTIRNLKIGDYFKRKSTSNVVYVRGKYVMEIKKFSCYRFDDVNREMFFSGDKKVCVEFDF